MLLIEQYEYSTPANGRYVKCPSCKVGRLFDRPGDIPVMSLPVGKTAPGDSSMRIYIKCPKCSRLIGVKFLN